MAETQTQSQSTPPTIAAPRTDRDLLQEILDAQKPLTPTKLSMETIEGFEAIQRAARLLSASSLVPDVYKGNLPNCTIAMNMASRLGADPLMIMQNLYIVHGKPGWSSQFYIAAFNSCGRFTPIHYRYTGEKGKDSWGCIAWAKERETGEIVEGPEINISMAKAEGWYAKNGSKWQTMPQLMLDYRSASFLVRTVAPELTMGLKTVEEIRDGDVTEEELPTPTAAPAATPEPAPGATTTDKIKGKLAARAKPFTPSAEPSPSPEPKADPPKAAEPASDNRSRNARIAKIREEAKERHGELFADAWADACRECANGKPSTQWSEKEILAVTDYLSRWRSLPVEDATQYPGVDPEAAAILTGEREPGEEG